MVSYRLPPNAIDRVAVAYSPLAEAMLSLKVLTHPRQHPLHHDFVRRLRALPAPLARELASYRFAVTKNVPVFLFADSASGFDSFEDELARFAEVDAATFRFEFTRGLTNDLPYDPALLDDPRLRARLAEGGGEELRLALEEPERFRAAFVAFLERYWRTAFRREWRRIEPQLAETVAEAGRVLAAEGPYAFLAGISPRIRADARGGVFTIEKDVDYEGEIGEGELYVALASAFVWPHLMVSIEGPWPHALIYPPPFVTGEARAPLAPAELVRLLRALGDDTRLRALKLIAQRPRSTQELAPLLGISEPALSKHLRLLTESGVLARRREGHYVLYSLVPGSVGRLEASVGAFLGGPAQD